MVVRSSSMPRRNVWLVGAGLGGWSSILMVIVLAIIVALQLVFSMQKIDVVVEQTSTSWQESAAVVNFLTTSLVQQKSNNEDDTEAADGSPYFDDVEVKHENNYYKDDENGKIQYLNVESNVPQTPTKITRTRSRGKPPRQEILLAQKHGKKQRDIPPTIHDPIVLQQQKEIPLAPPYPYNFSAPVLVLSLPKSGTTSLHRFFQCGAVSSAHTWGKHLHVTADGQKSFRIGQCLQENYLADRPLLTGCRSDFYTAFSDIGDISSHGCFYPSLQALDRIARDYPHATIILSFRDNGWYEAARNFRNLAERWRRKCPQFPNTTDPNVWQDFYVQHRQGIRDMVQHHPTLRYLEFNLTDPTAGEQLSQFTGIDATCWRNCKPAEKCPNQQREQTLRQQKMRRQQHALHQQQQQQQQRKGPYVLT